MDRRAVYVVGAALIATVIFYQKNAIIVGAKKMVDSGLNLIAEFEQFSPTPYPDARGESVGFGHFILPGDNLNFPLSRDDAYALLQLDADTARRAIKNYVSVPLSINQRDALTSLVYNIGVGAFAGSTLLRKLNAGDYAGAAAQFAVWRKSQGAVLDALVVRRAREQALFLTA